MKKHTPIEINHPVQPTDWLILIGRRKLSPTPYPAAFIDLRALKSIILKQTIK